MVELLKEGMNPAENPIDGLAFASVILPFFNDSLVVAVHPKMSARTSKPQDIPDQEFETNGLGPSNVS